MTGLVLGAEGAQFTVSLPYDQTATVTARGLLSDLTTRFFVRNELKSDALLVLHELLVNGLVHGEPTEDGQIVVSAHIDDGVLTVSVLDGGTSGVVAARPFTLDRPNGRGLAIVEGLSDAWAVDRSSTGTRVSALLLL